MILSGLSRLLAVQPQIEAPYACMNTASKQERTDRLRLTLRRSVISTALSVFILGTILFLSSCDQRSTPSSDTPFETQHNLDTEPATEIASTLESSDNMSTGS